MIPHASIHIFRSKNEIAGLYDTLFHGILLTKGLPWVVQMLLVVSYSFSFALAVFALREDKNRALLWSRLSRVLAMIGFFSMNVLLIDPWDELFINLQHSLNFTLAGKFSYSLLKPTEGTADFLPYFLIGLLGKLGLGIPELSFIFSLVGGIFCCKFGSELIQKLDTTSGKEWGFLGMSLFAPLALNSSTGFTATLATALVLYSIKELFFSPVRLRAYFIVSLLPLIRFEYLWCTLLLLGASTLWHKQSSRLFTFLSFLPTALLTLWRWKTFGTLIPLPILYKSTLSGPFSASIYFFTLGMRNLVSDLVSSFALPSLLSFFLMTRPLNKKKGIKLFSWMLCLLFIFIFPYYLSGGDWFPTAWGRYLLPFSTTAFLAFLYALGLSLKELLNEPYTQSRFRLMLPSIVALFLICVCLQFGSYARLYGTLFTSRKTLADLDYHTDRRTNYRTHYLSQVGKHLHHTTDKEAVIASSEISSIMYFAERETLDTLGLTNLEIISQPLRVPASILRRVPKDNELPYLIFKRVNQEIISKHKPEILYAFDFILKVLMRETPFQEIDAPLIFLAIRRWEERFRGLITPLYGGIEKILNLGYQPVVVMYENQFATLYFVSNDYAKTHFSLLKRLGFEENHSP